MKFLRLLVVIILFYQPVFSQTEQNFDDLFKKVQSSEGKEKLKWLDSLATETYFARGKNYDSLALETVELSIQLDTIDVGAYHIVNYANRIARTKSIENALEVLEDFKANHLSKLKNPRRILNIYKAIALLNYNADNFDLANINYDKALEAGIKTTDSQAIGEIYMGKGMVTYAKGKLLESTQFLQQSIPYFRASGGVNAIINVKNIMTSLYSESGFYEQAQKEREEALKLAKEKNHHLFLSQIYFNHGVEWVLRDRLEKAIPLIEKSVSIVDSSKYKSYYKPIYLAKLASVYARLGELQKAQDWFNILELEPRKNAVGEPQSHYLEAKRDIAFAKKDFVNALKLGEEYYNYKKEINQTQGMEGAVLFLSKVKEGIGDNEKALKYFKEYDSIKEAVSSIQNTKSLAYYQTLYETEKRDATIASQEKDIALLDAKNRIQQQWLLFGGLSLLLLAGLLYFWKSRKAAQNEKQLQKQFSQDLLNAQENERKTIAKELHDSIGQDLLLIKNSLSVNPEESSGMVDKTIEDIRALSRNLHPVELEKFGLTKAIENLIERVSNLTSIYFTEEIDNIDNSFSQEEEINLYRIIQECINNIIKHSKATASKLTIDDDEKAIIIKIQDNGQGFKFEDKKVTTKSLGLQSLMERVDYLKGKIEFDSNPKKGTSVMITLFKNE